MSRTHPTSPTRQYVNGFLLAHSQQPDTRHVVRQSHALPVLDALPDVPPPPFERFGNRLKVMADLDPVRYPTPRPGRFELCTRVEENKGVTEARFAVHLVFDDTPADPAVEIRFEPLSQTFEPGPDATLY